MRVLFTFFTKQICFAEEISLAYSRRSDVESAESLSLSVGCKGWPSDGNARLIFVRNFRETFSLRGQLQQDVEGCTLE